jgi:hypothetical protein
MQSMVKTGGLFVRFLPSAWLTYAFWRLWGWRLVASLAVIAACHAVQWWTTPAKRKKPLEQTTRTPDRRLFVEPDDLVVQEEAERNESSNTGKKKEKVAGEEAEETSSPANADRSQTLESQQRRTSFLTEEEPPREETDDHPGLDAFWHWYDAEASSFRCCATKDNGSVPPFPSRLVTEHVQLRVTNALEENLAVDWINYQGLPETRGTIAPGDTWTQATELDHPWAFRSAEEDHVLLRYIPHRVIPTIEEAPTAGTDGAAGIHRFTIRPADPDSSDRCSIDDPAFPFPAAKHFPTPTAAASWAVLHCQRCSYDSWDVLAKYFTKIVSHPEVSNYRRIRKDNSTFHHKVWSTPARGILLASGFVERDDFAEFGCSQPLSRERVQDLSLILYMVERAASGQSVSQQAVGEAQRRKRMKHDMTAEPEANETGKGVRQATVADQAKWDEERASQQQFGFDIYGHGESSCGTTIIVQSPSFPIPSGFDGIQAVSAMSNLPGHEQALEELQRLCREFEPVVRARGWKVLALTEMCCCGDGDEFLPRRTSSPKPSHVGGYCVSTGDGRTALGIHIRLRPAGSCQYARFFPYEQLVSTMAHELAHIAVSPHNDEFYRVMAAIEQERITYLAEGRVTGEDGFPILLDTGRKLGSGKNGSSNPIGSKELKERVAKAAVERQRKRKRK